MGLSEDYTNLCQEASYQVGGCKSVNCSNLASYVEDWLQKEREKKKKNENKREKEKSKEKKYAHCHIQLTPNEPTISQTTPIVLP